MKDRIAAVLRRIADRLDNELGITEKQFDQMCADGEPSVISLLYATNPPSIYLNGTPAVWSEDFHAFVSRCPTSCDDDCELNDGGCHEYHQMSWRRDHDPVACEHRQLPLYSTSI